MEVLERMGLVRQENLADQALFSEVWDFIKTRNNHAIRVHIKNVKAMIFAIQNHSDRALAWK